MDLVPLSKLGKRISIIGMSSAGKSTLADALSRKLDVPCLHLDQIAFKKNTNWARRPDEEFLDDLDRFLQEHDEWVMEGNYSFCMSKRLPLTDSVIWVDNQSKSGFLWRYITRSLINNKERKGRLEGAVKEFNWEMITHYLFKHPDNTKKYSSLLKDHNIDPVMIRSMRALKAYYDYWDLSRD